MQTANMACQMRNSVASAVALDEGHRDRREVEMDAGFSSAVEEKPGIVKDETCVLTSMMRSKPQGK